MINSVTKVKQDTLCKRVANKTRFIILSDVHLGHPRTPTWHTIQRLKRYVINAAAMSDADAILITGDFFDRLLMLPAAEVAEIYDFIKEMLVLSVKCKCPIRILEGTPSHDWKQSTKVIEFNELSSIKADVQYVDKLSIVHDDSLGMTIGYVPDEWSETCEQTTEEFRELLATHGLDRVDIILMHGMFEFQVPAAAAKATSHFKEDIWNEWVNKAIFIGHDHRFKHKYNIVIPSSFNRLAQNEEDAKGFLVADIDGDLVDVFHVENEDAMSYVTIGNKDMSDYDIVKAVDSVLCKFAEETIPFGFISVKYHEKYDLTPHIVEWKKAFKNVSVVGVKESDEAKIKAEVDSNFKLEGDVINITEENVDGMILREVDVPSELMEIFVKEVEFIKAAI